MADRVSLKRLTEQKTSQGPAAFTVKVAGIQFACGPDKERNLKKARDLALLALEREARILCFQELFNTFWFPSKADPSCFDLAEGEDGPTLSLMRDLSREGKATFVCPIFERDGDSFYNTAFVVHNGEVLGRYRKIHLPHLPLWQEKFYFKPGDLGFPVFDTPYGRIAVQICWDNFFPEGARILALKGAEIIFAPTACAFASHPKWERAMAANAHMNGIFIVRVNRVGREEDLHFYGKSFCVSPEGELLCEPSGLKEGIILFDIDLKEIERVRKEWSFLPERKAGLYREIVEDFS